MPKTTEYLWNALFASLYCTYDKFENMSEDEAKAMQAEIEAAEAEKQQGGLFGEE